MLAKPPRRRLKTHRRMSPLWSVLGAVGLTIWTAFALAPVIITLLSVFKSNAEIIQNPWGLPSTLDFGGLSRAWNGADFGQPARRYAINSAIAVTVGVTIGISVSTLGAYALARTASSLSFFTRYFVLLMAVPTVTAWIALFKLVSTLDMLSNPVYLGLVYSAVITPFATVIIRAFFAGFPVDVIEAAQMDGASEFSAFIRVVLPLSGHALTVVGLLTSILLWNDLGLALILQLDAKSHTLPVGIALLEGQFTSDRSAQNGLLVIGLIPVLFLYAIASRRITEGMQFGALK